MRKIKDEDKRRIKGSGKLRKFRAIFPSHFKSLFMFISDD